jgi:hypothetical protein
MSKVSFNQGMLTYLRNDDNCDLTIMCNKTVYDKHGKEVVTQVSITCHSEFVFSKTDLKKYAKSVGLDNDKSLVVLDNSVELVKAVIETMYVNSTTGLNDITTLKLLDFVIKYKVIHLARYVGEVLAAECSVRGFPKNITKEIFLELYNGPLSDAKHAGAACLYGLKDRPKGSTKFILQSAVGLVKVGAYVDRYGSKATKYISDKEILEIAPKFPDFDTFMNFIPIWSVLETDPRFVKLCEPFHKSIQDLVKKVPELKGPPVRNVTADDLAKLSLATSGKCGHTVTTGRSAGFPCSGAILSNGQCIVCLSTSEPYFVDMNINKQFVVSLAPGSLISTGLWASGQTKSGLPLLVFVSELLQPRVSPIHCTYNVNFNFMVFHPAYACIIVSKINVNSIKYNTTLKDKKFVYSLKNNDYYRWESQCKVEKKVHTDRFNEWQNTGHVGSLPLPFERQIYSERPDFSTVRSFSDSLSKMYGKGDMKITCKDNVKILVHEIFLLSFSAMYKAMHECDPEGAGNGFVVDFDSCDAIPVIKAMYTGYIDIDTASQKTIEFMRFMGAGDEDVAVEAKFTEKKVCAADLADHVSSFLSLTPTAKAKTAMTYKIFELLKKATSKVGRTKLMTLANVALMRSNPTQLLRLKCTDKKLADILDTFEVFDRMSKPHEGPLDLNEDYSKSENEHLMTSDMRCVFARAAVYNRCKAGRAAVNKLKKRSTISSPLVGTQVLVCLGAGGNNKMKVCLPGIDEEGKFFLTREMVKKSNTDFGNMYAEDRKMYIAETDFVQGTSGSAVLSGNVFFRMDIDDMNTMSSEVAEEFPVDEKNQVSWNPTPVSPLDIARLFDRLHGLIGSSSSLGPSSVDEKADLKRTSINPTDLISGEFASFEKILQVGQQIDSDIQCAIDASLADMNGGGTEENTGSE